MGVRQHDRRRVAPPGDHPAHPQGQAGPDRAGPPQPHGPPDQPHAAAVARLSARVQGGDQGAAPRGIQEGEARGPGRVPTAGDDTRE